MGSYTWHRTSNLYPTHSTRLSHTPRSHILEYTTEIRSLHRHYYPSMGLRVQTTMMMRAGMHRCQRRRMLEKLRYQSRRLLIVLIPCRSPLCHAVLRCIVVRLFSNASLVGWLQFCRLDH